MERYGTTLELRIIIMIKEANNSFLFFSERVTNLIALKKVRLIVFVWPCFTKGKWIRNGNVVSVYRSLIFEES